MQNQIRNGIFETNSSSSHSIVIDSSNGYIIPESDCYNEIHIYTGEYGWEECQYDNFSDKASYALTYAYNNDISGNAMDILREVIESETKADVVFYNSNGDVITDCSNGDDNYSGYIDHQSTDEYSDIADVFSSRDKLADFLFGRNSILYTDNDNH